MFCPACGAKVPWDAGQCPRCKTWFRVEVEAKSPAQAPAEALQRTPPDLRELAFLYPDKDAVSPPPPRAIPASGGASTSARAVRLWKLGLLALVGLYLAALAMVTVLAVREGLAERRRLLGTVGGLPPSELRGAWQPPEFQAWGGA